MSALNTQVGGTHYSEMPIQPMEFAMTQMYDFATASILKYVSRHRQKNGRQDIQKAIHIVELRNEIIVKHGLYDLLQAVRSVRRVSGLTWVSSNTHNVAARDVHIYVEVNAFNESDARAIYALDEWFRHGSRPDTRPRLALALNALLQEYDAPAPLGRNETHYWEDTDELGRTPDVCRHCGAVDDGGPASREDCSRLSR